MPVLAHDLCINLVCVCLGDTVFKSWSNILISCMNTTTLKTLDSHSWAVLVREKLIF